MIRRFLDVVVGACGLALTAPLLAFAALAAGLWDYLRKGTPAGWEAPEGTR